MNPSKIKILLLVIAGNILEYYDFLLFAHIGYVITPQYIPEAYAQHSHVFSLVVFSLPFIVRPVGGWFFGRIADKVSTSKALDATLRFASLASFLIAILPGHSKIGIMATIAFVFLRSMQGFALGGEYTTAGTYLMDRFVDNRSLISGTLGASGTIGSLIAFTLSALYINFFKDTEVWRLFFIFGAVATYLSYYFRSKHLHTFKRQSHGSLSRFHRVGRISIYKTLALGAITSVSCFIPMVYSNFYLTKVLGLDVNFGLIATLISLVTYVIFTPMAGYVSDRIGLPKFVSKGLMVALPLVMLGFELISRGLLLGQFFLTLCASIVGANIHVIMNQLFPLAQRSRSINTSFTIGASLGGLLPAFSGYLNIHYHISSAPFVVMSLLIFINLYLFVFRKQDRLEVAQQGS